MRINYAIKQPWPVGAGLVPVQSGQGRSVPVGDAAGAGTDRFRPVPTGAGVADRPQETLYMFNFKLHTLIITKS